MLVRWITARQYRKGLQALQAGDLDGLLRQFHPQATLTFVGDTPLGAQDLSGPVLRAWFERFRRLLPGARFEVQELAVVGPPWRTLLMARVVIRSTVDGEPYSNQFAHRLVIRWGRVTDDLVLEDTQRWERACRRLVAAGVTEAAAAPLSAQGPVPHDSGG